MSDAQSLPFKYFVTREAAEILGLSRRTLEKHRTYGTGPRFLKLGGRVVYKIDDLRSWAERGARRSTSDLGEGVVLPARRHDPIAHTRAKQRGK